MSAVLPPAWLLWLHLVALTTLFGAAAFPLYAPTGRFLDRPLRVVVRAAAFGALATALMRGGWALSDLARLTLLAFACLVSVSLRRNSWTARAQAPVLATLGSMALASIPFADQPSPMADGSRVLAAIALIAIAVLVGASPPLLLLVSRAGRGAATASVAAAALHRRYPVAACAAGLLLVAAAQLAFGHGSAWPRHAAAVALLLSLIALAAIDRFVIAPRLSAGPAIRAAAMVSIALQGVIAVTLLGAIVFTRAPSAVAWTDPAASVLDGASDRGPGTGRAGAAARMFTIPSLTDR